jgi:hypothetical protein
MFASGRSPQVLWSADWRHGLTFGADSEELELVGDGDESASFRYASFDLRGETIFDLNYLRASCANEMVVVTIVPFGQQFEPSQAVPEIIAFDHLHPLQQVNGSIDGRQVTVRATEGAVNLFDGQGMSLLMQYPKNRLSRARKFT